MAAPRVTEELGFSNRGQAWGTRGGSGGKKSRQSRHRVRGQEGVKSKSRQKGHNPGSGGGETDERLSPMLNLDPKGLYSDGK